MQPAARDVTVIPSLDAPTIVAQHRRPRSRPSTVLAVGATVVIVLGFDAAPSSRPPEPHPSRQAAAPPTAAATPPGPVASAAASPVVMLQPAKRFVRRPEKPVNGAYESDIIDRSLPSTYRGGTHLRLVRDPSIATLPDRVDDVEPEHLRVSGVEVRVYRTADGEGTQQAAWVRKRTYFVLLWQPQRFPHQISESDIRWMIAASISGRF